MTDQEIAHGSRRTAADADSLLYTTFFVSAQVPPHNSNPTTANAITLNDSFFPTVCVCHQFTDLTKDALKNAPFEGLREYGFNIVESGQRLIEGSGLKIKKGENGGDTNIEIKKREHLATCLTLLTFDIGVRPEEITIQREDPQNSFRKDNPYYRIEIDSPKLPSSPITIFTCDQVGEATFVYKGTLEDRAYTKEELKELGAHRIVDGSRTYEERLKEAILNLEKVCVGNSEITALMDESYFTEENVRYDLEAFAEKAGVSEPSCLNTGNLNEKAVCANNETMSLERYIHQARKHIPNLNNKSDGDVLYYLKELINKSSQKSFQRDLILKGGEIKKVLTHFANQARKKVNYLRLTDGSPFSIPLSDGTEMSFFAYLNGVAKHFEWSEEKTQAEILSLLKKKIGISEFYFTKENIRHDLEAFAENVGLPDLVHLNTGNLEEARAVCANGETMTLRQFLLRTYDQIPSLNGKPLGKVLYYLKELINESSQKSFQKDSILKGKEIKEVLTYLANKAGTTVKDLRLKNVMNIPIPLSDGTEMGFFAYLNRAAKHFKWTKKTPDEILSLLKGKIGIETPSKMTKSYFTPET